MTIAARTIGGPGAGKTSRAMEIMELCLDRMDIDPMEFGFVSFTRSARDEAIRRAADLLRIKEGELRKDGYFRTLHSIAYRSLGVAEGELITGEGEDSSWLKEALQDDQASFQSRRSLDDDGIPVMSQATAAEKSLAMWDAARNRLISIDDVHEECLRTDDRTACLDETIRVIEYYEEAKKASGRLDFTDLLLRFSGKKYAGSPSTPLQDCTPQCSCPVLPVFIHDEMQDCSQLTAGVFRRLAECSNYVYLFGDSMQAIYSFCGSDGRIFSEWPVAKEEILPLSHRCRANILSHADSIIHRSYPARPFSAEHAGGVVARTHIEDALSRLEPGEDVLVLARTNAQANDLTRYLDDLLLPWKPTKGNGGFNAPAKAEGIRALVSLECGMPVNTRGVRRMLELLPSRAGGEWLFEKGSKKKAASDFFSDDQQATLQTLHLFGATDKGKELIFSGKYRDMLGGIARKMYDVAMSRDMDALTPTIRVGTIHSSKGQEADHVILLNSLPFPTVRAMEESNGLQEERRVWYVGCSRARHKLTIASGGPNPFPDL